MLLMEEKAAWIAWLLKNAIALGLLKMTHFKNLNIYITGPEGHIQLGTYFCK